MVVILLGRYAEILERCGVVLSVDFQKFTVVMCALCSNSPVINLEKRMEVFKL